MKCAPLSDRTKTMLEWKGRGRDDAPRFPDDSICACISKRVGTTTAADSRLAPGCSHCPGRELAGLAGPAVGRHEPGVACAGALERQRWQQCRLENSVAGIGSRVARGLERPPLH